MSIEVIWETPIGVRKFSTLDIGAPFVCVESIDPPPLHMKVGEGKSVVLDTGMLMDVPPATPVAAIRLRISVWPK